MIFVVWTPAQTVQTYEIKVISGQEWWSSSQNVLAAEPIPDETSTLKARGTLEPGDRERGRKWLMSLFLEAAWHRPMVPVPKTACRDAGHIWFRHFGTVAMKAAVFLQVGQTDGRIGGFVWTELSVKLNLIGGWVSGKGGGGGWREWIYTGNWILLD